MMHKQFALLALAALSMPALALESMTDASPCDRTGCFSADFGGRGVLGRPA